MAVFVSLSPNLLDTHNKMTLIRKEIGITTKYESAKGAEVVCSIRILLEPDKPNVGGKKKRMRGRTVPPPPIPKASKGVK